MTRQTVKAPSGHGLEVLVTGPNPSATCKCGAEFDSLGSMGVLNKLDHHIWEARKEEARDARAKEADPQVHPL